jgi:hypothetical protein
MHQLGCHETGRPFFWCPRCGTTKTCEGDIAAPALVEWCRKYESRAVGPIDANPKSNEPHQNAWKGSGISEAIHKPEDRPT